jgi:hypothetical protein
MLQDAIYGLIVRHADAASPQQADAKAIRKKWLGSIGILRIKLKLLILAGPRETPRIPDYLI